MGGLAAAGRRPAVPSDPGWHPAPSGRSLAGLGRGRRAVDRGIRDGTGTARRRALNDPATWWFCFRVGVIISIHHLALARREGWLKRSAEHAIMPRATSLNRC